MGFCQFAVGSGRFRAFYWCFMEAIHSQLFPTVSSRGYIWDQPPPPAVLEPLPVRSPAPFSPRAPCPSPASVADMPSPLSPLPPLSQEGDFPSPRLPLSPPARVGPPLTPHTIVLLLAIGAAVLGAGILGVITCRSMGLYGPQVVEASLFALVRKYISLLVEGARTPAQIPANLQQATPVDYQRFVLDIPEQGEPSNSAAKESEVGLEA
ncbi:hypothetical protein L7F22_016949 [Adiantum nelumboides]|nr:hypothetical protein [Adiantum nelumboides]